MKRKPASPHRPAVLRPLLAFALVAPFAASSLDAQYGAIGLCGVGGQRFGNEELTVHSPQSGDRFGEALATGDFNGDGADDLATGVPYGSVNFVAQPDSGIVFIRYGVPGRGLAGGPVTQVLSQAGGPDPGETDDRFGSALASCDFNGDGFDDLAVGIPFEDPGPGIPFDTGAVDVFYGSSAGLASAAAQHLTQETEGMPGDSETADYFGAVLACGNLNNLLIGDELFDDLAIGVPDETLADGTANPLFGAGMLVVARGTAAGLSGFGALIFHQDVGSMADVAETFDFFGSALAVGDFDGDGFDDLAVGVPGEDNVGDTAGRGAVQVVFGAPAGLGTAGNILRTESALGGNSEIGDRMGLALAAGDLDGDGFDDLAVGVPFEDLSPAVDAGQVVAIYGASSGFDFTRTQFWSENVIHGAGASENDDLFGFALASGDFDRDGRDDLAIGHPGEFILVPQDGLVTVVMGTASGISAARRHGLAAGYHGNPGVPNQANRNYGSALSIGDLDGDGHADLGIGAPFEDEGLGDVGAEVVLYGSIFCDGFDVGNAGFWSDQVP